MAAIHIAIFLVTFEICDFAKYQIFLLSYGSKNSIITITEFSRFLSIKA